MKYLVSLFFFCFALLGFSQQTEYVDFKRINASVNFDVSQSKVYGKFECTFEILKDVDSIYLDAVDMRYMKMIMFPKNKKADLLHRGEVVNNCNDKKIWLVHDFKKGQEYGLRFFFFKNNPKKAMYFIDWEHENGNKQIWTQGQGKYTSNWLPSIDDMNDKIEFDLSITFDKDYEVIANGKLLDKQINESTITWHYDMQQPMSSYLVALAIGKYDKKVAYSKSGIPLEMYYYPEDSLKFEPTYRYTKQIFDFLEEEIGVPYPWQNYKQVPVKDFLYAGMENTSCTIFADSYVIDSIAFVDKNYVNVNAHELAHQWFGNLVTETSGTHHWLQEGFATYYALLAEREVFGDDYYYWRLYEYAQELLEQDKAGGSTSLLDSKSSSTTFYKKGAWALHILREKVGDKAFKKAVKNYLLKYQFKNVETDDFINEVEKASGQDLSEFVENWLESDELNYGEMEEILYLNSISIKQYLQYNCKETPEVCKLFLLGQNNSFYKARIVKDLGNNISKSTFLIDDVKVRQAIAKTLTTIPSELKTDYESLLDDKSYITIEAALYNLWANFPQERHKYLNKTNGIQGFSDKNVRMLWLTLALVTEDFETENKKTYFDELIDYTSPKYGFESRINAFRYLSQIQSCNDACKENLQQATNHHNWQFSKFAKELLKTIK
ncbi:M1 family metallopeptidase [Sabulilitoribacter multivorans]|uniref:Aminopeptidase N n=1 Tax=Flaviramulus multivorans TaxID=1304750 RepID=A0ABS9IIT0_9FLAO|nr:M1 family metallopeptidase [Flaviramulus multivorans]MCF7560092.1 M1 family metallopeptidase [Flaviramulus multivorans]